MNEVLSYVFRLIAAFLLAGLLTACSDRGPELAEGPGDACVAAGGTWLAEHNECEIGDQAWCESQGGTFEECASPCRHSEGVAACVAMCQPLCKFAP